MEKRRKTGCGNSFQNESEAEGAMTMKTRRGMNRRKRMGYRLIVLTVMCLLVTGFYAKHRLQQKNAAYQKQEEQLMAQIEEEEQRSKDIEELGKYVQTKKYVEEVAKERLGLVYPDEILFKAKE